MFLVAVVVGCAFGCSTPLGDGSPPVDVIGGGGAGETVQQDGTGLGDGIHEPAVEKWWTCPTVTGKAPTRAASCEKPDDGSYGCKRTFTGLTVGGQNFTCNLCLGGDPAAQGRWRALAFDSEDPEKALPGGRKELLVIDGNTWHLHARSELDGKIEEVRVDGWYMCADAAELASQRLIFTTTLAQPQDGLGWFSPDTFSGEFLTKGGNLLAWGLNAGFERDWIGYVNYCKIGTTVGGVLCREPFSTL
jgi:hypothetical protein